MQNRSLYLHNPPHSLKRMKKQVKLNLKLIFLKVNNQKNQEIIGR